MIESLGLDSLELSRFSINDNAANMKCAIQQSQYLTEYNCDIHTLELCIKYSFRDTPGMLDVLRASKQVAKFVNKSSKAQTQLKDTCKKYKIKFKKPVNPPNTRWSGYHKNLTSILYLKQPLMYLFSENSDWDDYSLSSDDWKLVESATNLLKFFCDTVNIWQSESTPTLNTVIERVFTMNEEITKYIKNNKRNKIAVKFAEKLLHHLKLRFPNSGTDNKFRCVANYLSPNYRGIHLHQNNKYDDTKADIKLMSLFSSNISPETAASTAGSDDSDDDLNLSPTSKLKKQYMSRQSTTTTTTIENTCPFLKEFTRYESFSLAKNSVDV